MAIKGKPKTEEHKRKIALAHIGMPFPDSAKKKLSDARKGVRMSPATEFKKGMKSSLRGTKVPLEKVRKGVETRKRNGSYKISLERRKEMSQNAARGEKHHNWKGGATPELTQLRHSFEYKLWRESVFERDDWTCVFCKERGGKLNADHIKPFSMFPELRFAIDNGRTLCVPCHRKTDTYGFKLVYQKSCTGTQ